jgi:hypothetical protein
MAYSQNSLGGDLLSEEARDTVLATVRWEDGKHPDRPGEWVADLVQDLTGRDRLGARIALLAAFAPAAVGRGEADFWGRADLVRLVAYGAIVATDHVTRALTARSSWVAANRASVNRPTVTADR